MSKNRVQLDSLRGCAIAVVMLHHFISRPLFFSGFGVIFFFVLSGFFATRILLRLKENIASGDIAPAQALAQYSVDRYLRIFPLYYLVLLITLIAHVPFAKSTFAWNGLFLSNFHALVTGEWPGRFSQFWSLSVLEQFYLFWPLAVLWTPRKYLLHVIAALIALGPVYRLLCLALDLSPLAWIVMPFASFDQLGAGALLALIETSDSPVLSRVLDAGGWLGGPIFVALMECKFFGIEAPGSAIYVSTVASWFFIWVAHRASRGIGGFAGGILSNRHFAAVGQMSYSIFLLHTFTQLLLPHPPAIRKLMATDWRAALLIPATLLFAHLSWQFIETPLRRFRKALSSMLATAPVESRDLAS